MPPAKTGNLKTSKNAVTQTLTRNRGILNHLSEGVFKLFMVHKKLIEPAIDLTPARCNLKIIISTLLFLCPTKLLSGG
jgi:hypothetical protein